MVSKDWPEWLEYLEKQLPPSVDRAVKDVEHTVHDLALHADLYHWHPILTAPCNQDLELKIVEGSAMSTLPFPCRHLNDGKWINVDLGTCIKIQPVSWRVWQHRKSPHPHSLPAK